MVEIQIWRTAYLPIVVLLSVLHRLYSSVSILANVQTLLNRYSFGVILMDESEKYAATYKLGNSTIHIVFPPPMTQEQKEQVIRDMHLAGWAIIKKLMEEGKPV